MVAFLLSVLAASEVSFNAPSSSRIYESRISSPRPTGDAELPPCSADAIADALRLCGGSTGTKCDVVLVGCGVPKRGMGWYHGKQMLEGDVPSAKMTAVVEPWFLGPGADSPPGETFKKWADEMEAEHGTKFVKDISELEITVRTYPHRHTHTSLSLGVNKMGRLSGGFGLVLPHAHAPCHVLGLRPLAAPPLSFAICPRSLTRRAWSPRLRRAPRSP